MDCIIPENTQVELEKIKQNKKKERKSDRKSS